MSKKKKMCLVVKVVEKNETNYYTFFSLSLSFFHTIESPKVYLYLTPPVVQLVCAPLFFSTAFFEKTTDDDDDDDDDAFFFKLMKEEREKTLKALKRRRHYRCASSDEMMMMMMMSLRMRCDDEGK